MNNTEIHSRVKKQSNTSVKVKPVHLVVISMLIILMSYSSYFVLGENSYLSIFDGLDSNHVGLAIKSGNFRLFDMGAYINQQPVGGVPAYKDPLPNPQVLLYELFQPFFADVINRVLISLIAFWGMLTLLRHLSLKINTENGNQLYLVGVSLGFSLCYFWPYAGISVAGLPLIFYAYLISDTKPLKAISIAVLYTMYSSLALVGLFLLVILGLFELVRWWRDGLNLRRMGFIVGLALLYALFNINFIMSVFSPLFVSHRSEMDLISTYPSLTVAVKQAFRMAAFNYGHNSSYPSIIIFSSIFTIVLAKIRHIKLSTMLVTAILAYVMIIVVSLLFNNKNMATLQSSIPVIRMLQLQRFYWLLSPIQYILFFETLLLLSKLNLKIIAVTLLVLQLMLLLWYVNSNAKKGIREILKHNAGITYAEYYSKPLFKEVKDYIAKPQDSYRVVSVGLSPAVALYNGFYTIDGYWSSGYPLQHKKRFGEMQHAELSKNKELFKTFYEWGSVCYLFSDDIDKQIGYGGGYSTPHIGKESTLSIENLSIDSTILTDMDCEYVFSALPINNSEDINLEFKKSFMHDESPYKVYLYSVVTDETIK